jgi:hypothetical protein
MNTLRSGLLLLAGLVGSIAPLRAADTVTLRLHFQGRAPDAPIVTAESAQRGDYALTPLPLEEIEAKRSWWLLGFDAKGGVLYRTPVRNHQWRRLEAFDPQTGRIAEVREIAVSQGVFEVSFPYDPRLVRVALRTDAASSDRRRVKSEPLIELQRWHLDRMLQLGARKTFTESAATTTLIDNGAAADRLDLVFVGDGYTAAEIGKWQTDAQSVVNGLMSDPLFAVYRRRINIRRVDVASAESGVDEPDLGIFRDTAMDSAFNCANIDRLLCANNTKVLSILGGVLQPDARDVVVVVANSTRYGGSGGPIAAISMHSAAVELALHELGHTLFGLADEYDYGTCNLGFEPSAGNASLIASRAVKWGVMVSSLTAVPTVVGQYPNGTVGIFEGGQYCKAGKYRPTEDSKMRSLGQPWHAVNEAVAADVFAGYTRNSVKPRIKVPLGARGDARNPSGEGRPVLNTARGRSLPKP